MNDSNTHFGTACPHCAASLRVRRVLLGREVRCKRCQRTFRVPVPEALPADPAVAGSGSTPARGDHRIDAVPDRLGARATSGAGLLVDDRLAAEYQQLNVMHEQLQAAHQQLEVEHGRLLSESRRLQAERLQQRDAELDAVRAEAARLRGELQQAREQARTATALRCEVDRLRAEDHRLRAEVEDFRRILEQAQRTDRDELARLEAEFTRLVESNRQLQDRYELSEQLCKEYHDRNQALLWDLARLKSETARKMRSAQPSPSPWVTEPRELPAAAGSWSVVPGP